MPEHPHIELCQCIIWFSFYRIKYPSRVKGFHAFCLQYIKQHKMQRRKASGGVYCITICKSLYKNKVSLSQGTKSKLVFLFLFLRKLQMYKLKYSIHLLCFKHLSLQLLLILTKFNKKVINVKAKYMDIQSVISDFIVKTHYLKEAGFFIILKKLREKLIKYPSI